MVLLKQENEAIVWILAYFEKRDRSFIPNFVREEIRTYLNTSPSEQYKQEKEILIGLVREFTNRGRGPSLKNVAKTITDLTPIGEEIELEDKHSITSAHSQESQDGEKSNGKLDQEPDEPDMYKRNNNPMQNLPRFFGDHNDKVDSPAYLEALETILEHTY